MRIYLTLSGMNNGAIRTETRGTVVTRANVLQSAMK